VVVLAQVSPRDRKPALFGDRSQDVQKIARRPRQSIEPRYNKNISCLEMGDHAAELKPIGLRSTGRLAPDLLYPGGAQLSDLGHPSIPARNPRIMDQFCPYILHLKSLFRSGARKSPPRDRHTVKLEANARWAANHESLLTLF
jgi:hypothetical protein